MNRSAAIIGMIVVFCSSASHSGAIDRLTGSKIVASGDIEQVRCPAFGKYDCLKWPDNLYQFSYQDICFTTDSYDCAYSCTGFVASKGAVLSLYTISSSRLYDASFNQVPCPSRY